MKLVPIAEATREELVKAIQSTHHHPDQIKRMEREIHNQRVNAVLAEMKRATEDSQEWAGKDRAKFMDAMHRFDIANAKLKELKG